jgi:DNA-binding NtrC family response regulator
MMTENSLLANEQKTPSFESFSWNFVPTEFLGRSAAAEQLRSLARKIAPTDATVLIRGESGVGKEFIARLIAQESSRSEAPFLRIDCASVPAERLDEMLFGHQSRLPGVQHYAFSLACGGTLLLEEISVLPLNVQGKLLEILQNQVLSENANLRLLATTNRSLEAKAQSGEFREDLLNALSIMPILVPPLRERREDISVLAEHFRQVYARKHGLEALGISSACQQALTNYSWPGNVRELETLIERAILVCQSGVLEPKHLALFGQSDAADASESEELAASEKKHIFAILRRCQNNRTHAAKRLGISIRTLRNKLREYRQQAQLTGEENPLLTANN